MFPPDYRAAVGPDHDLRPEWIEREAVRDLFRAVPAELAARHGIETAELGGATCVVVSSLPDVSVLDRAIGLGLERAPAPEDVEAIASFHAERGASAYVHVAPRAETRGTTALLRAAGFDDAYAWMKFTARPGAVIAGASPTLLPGLQVAEAGADDAELCGLLVSESFAMPPWTAEWLAATVGRPGWLWLVARDDGDPAGVAASYTAEGVAWLGLGGVRAAHRGKGIQRVLLRARIEAAAAAGCELVVTETGERAPDTPSFSYRNILAAGLEERYLRPNLVRRPR